MANSTKVTDFLKECIADAILKLLEEKPLEKITVPEISNLSGVGRATYFRHFKNKTEPIIYKLNKLWKNWAESHQVKVQDNFDYRNGKTYFEYHLSIKSITSLLYQRNLEMILFQCIYKIIYHSHGENLFECYQNSFYSYALFGLLDEWIKNGYHETPDEMQEIIKKIIYSPL